TLLKTKETLPRLEVMIYERDRTGFQVIDFRDSIHAYTVNYPVTYRTRTIAGEIDGSLSASIQKEGLDPGLASLLAKRFAWNIVLFILTRGEKFALLVAEKFINDNKYAGTEEGLGAHFNYDGKDVYGFPYQQAGQKDGRFYDEGGDQ